MASNAEIYLKNDHTRVINDLDVGTDKSTDPPEIRLRPSNPSVKVGGGAGGTSGSIRVRNAAGNNVGVLEVRDDAGYLELSEPSGDSVITMDARQSEAKRIEISHTGKPVATILENANGGAFVVHNTLNDAPAVEAETHSPGGGTDASGRIKVRNSSGDTTGELLGESGTLLLTDKEGPAESTAGGGEIVLGKSDDGALDIHIHATGKTNSNYGVVNNNRPKIYLNGPEATLELGRGSTSPIASPDNGEIIIRDDRAFRLLELRARGLSSGAKGEVIFRLSHTNVGEELRGAIRGHEKGLMIYDAGNRPALLIKPNGTVETRKSLKQNQSLP